MRKRTLLMSVATLAGLLLALAAGIALTAPDTDITWRVFGSAGDESTSTNYELGATAGQAATGAAGSTNYDLGAGFWYGVAAAGGAVPPPTPTATQPIPTDTPIPTATTIPTATPCPDFDGDTLCDDVDPDDDADGCTDIAEQQAKSEVSSGGGRNPLYHWDFMDQWTGGTKDKVIVIGDILIVVGRFGASNGSIPSKENAFAEAITPPAMATGYHASADRGPGLAGPNAWNVTPPDGSIVIGDILAAVAQFGHGCA